jgi:hypothetical protein
LTKEKRILLRRAWSRWRAVAQVIGDFQARIILTLFYFIFVTPGGLIVRSMYDPLRLKPPKGASMWVTYKSGQQSLDDARRQ